MNGHLNPSSTEAPALLFITDNSSMIVIVALSHDFAHEEKMYALQLHLNCDVQVKCPYAWLFVSVQLAMTMYGRDGCPYVWPVHLPFSLSFSLSLSAAAWRLKNSV